MNQAKSFYDQGLKAEQEGRFQEALRYYKASARSDGGFRPAFNNLGAIYSRAARPDLAIGFFKRAFELGTDDIVCFNLGSECFRMDNLDESERHLKMALRQNQRLLKAHILLAYLYDKRRQFDKSDIYFKNSLKLDRKNKTAALGYVVSLSDRNMFETALEVVDKYLKVSGSEPTLQNLRASFLLKLNRLDDSRDEFVELSQKSARFTNFTEHIKEARNESQEEYARMFTGFDDKMQERTDRLRARINKRKELLAKKKAGEPGPVIPETELKQDLKDLVDMSFLHLFKGDSEKAIQFLFQARKMKGQHSE